MKTTLESDMRRLRSLAFEREKWGGPLIRRIHRLPARAKKHSAFHLLQTLHPWLFFPVSLWPTNLDSVGNHLVGLILRGEKLTPQVSLLCQFLTTLPGEGSSSLIAEHEHRAQQLDFSRFFHATHKYTFLEDELARNRELQEQWRKTTEVFDVQKYQDSNGIIQRQFVYDWNIRNVLRLDWDRQDDQFYAVFNTFCRRWHLFGMAGDKPIILKGSVDSTPFGTVIFIPEFFSLDARRDIKWSSIRAMHRSRGAVNEGVKLGISRVERRAEAERAQKLLAQAKNEGVRASERDYWVMGQLGWDLRTDKIRLRRLLDLLKEKP